MKEKITKERLKRMVFDPMAAKAACLAIREAFIWEDSCEGHNFWSEVVDKLRAYVQKDGECEK